MTDAELSRLLFMAREHLSMWLDVVEKRTGKIDRTVVETIAGLDQYRAERGWNPHGFGGEGD